MRLSLEKHYRKNSDQKKFLNKILSYGVTVIVLIGLILLWEFFIPDILTKVLPRPSAIVSVISEKRLVLLNATRYTLTAAFLGFLMGNGVAIILAVTVIYTHIGKDTLYPMAVILKSIPLVALTPFIVMFFGQGLLAKVIVASLVCFFPTLVNMVQGLTSIDKQVLELMRTINATEQQVFWKIRVPFSLPYLFTSFKITSSAAVLGAIIGEWMGAWRGLGAMIVQSMFNMQGDLLWATMLVATIISILAYLIVALLEPIFISWHASTDDEP